ncbi:MAG: flagellar biosynthetic protein FliR [Geminicoccaceae bacterium]
MLADLLVGQTTAVLLVFARFGAALMLIPGFGEHHVLARMRLLLALLLSVLLSPALAGAMPALPRDPLLLAALVAPEVLVGLLLGFAARLALAAVHVGGSVIAMQSGLSAAAMFDPNEATTGTIPGSLLTAAAMTLLFAADFHHLLLRAIAASYAVFPVGAGVDMAAPAELLVRLSAQALATGVRIAAPMIVAGLVVNVGLGVMGRMVPSLPVFFVALPLQLLLALLILERSLPAAMALFGADFGRGIAWLGGGA